MPPATAPAQPQVELPRGSAVSGTLPGQVCPQYVRCNKPNCRCQAGHPHGPYYYRVWRDGGRVRKEYVSADRLDQVRAACATYRAYAEQLRGIRHQREALRKVIGSQWRGFERGTARAREMRGGAD